MSIGEVRMDNRRKFTLQFKAKVVLELLFGAKTLAQTGREYRLWALPPTRKGA